MKRVQILVLRRETVRLLALVQLAGVAGGQLPESKKIGLCPSAVGRTTWHGPCLPVRQAPRPAPGRTLPLVRGGLRRPGVFDATTIAKMEAGKREVS